MGKLTPIKKVAKFAGVSPGTVSHVLNHPEIVSEETRKRVYQAIEELGYVRNASAAHLRVGRSYALGLVVLDISNPYFTEVARGVEDAANEAGLVVILGKTDGSLKKEQRYLHVLEEQRVQGVLITPSQDDLQYLQPLRERGMAIINLGRAHQNGEFCCVTVDNIRGGELAMTHLLERGHRRIAFVHGPFILDQDADRQRGVYQAVTQAHLDPHLVVVDITVSGWNAQEGEACVEKLLHIPEPPTAVFCANDLLALGIMRGLTQRGLSLPRDMAIVGYDDIEFASMLSPSLTTIRLPKYQIGYKAVELLLDEANNSLSHQHQQVIYPPELIIRESSLSS